MPRRVQHFGLTVSNLDESLHFFCVASSLVLEKVRKGSGKIFWQTPRARSPEGRNRPGQLRSYASDDPVGSTASRRQSGHVERRPGATAGHVASTVRPAYGLPAMPAIPAG